MAAAAPLIIAVVGAAASTYAVIKQGQSAQAAADYNAKNSAQNAEIARKQGIAAQAQADRDSRLRIGSMTAAFGASGIESDTGSALDILKSSASQAKLESANIKYNYELKGLGYSSQSILDTASGDAASANSKWSAAGTLLAAAPKIYEGAEKYLASQQPKVTG